MRIYVLSEEPAETKIPSEVYELGFSFKKFFRRIKKVANRVGKTATKVGMVAGAFLTGGWSAAAGVTSSLLAKRHSHHSPDRRTYHSPRRTYSYQSTYSQPVTPSSASSSASLNKYLPLLLAGAGALLLLKKR